MWNSTAPERLQRPRATASLALRQAFVHHPHIGGVVFNLEWRSPKDAPRDGKIARPVVHLDTAVLDRDLCYVRRQRASAPDFYAPTARRDLHIGIRKLFEQPVRP